MDVAGGFPSTYSLLPSHDPAPRLQKLAESAELPRSKGCEQSLFAFLWHPSQHKGSCLPSEGELLHWHISSSDLSNAVADLKSEVDLMGFDSRSVWLWEYCDLF